MTPSVTQAPVIGQNKPITSRIARKIASTELGKTLFTKGELERFEAMKNGLPFPEHPTYSSSIETRILNFQEQLTNLIIKKGKNLVKQGLSLLRK